MSSPEPGDGSSGDAEESAAVIEFRRLRERLFGVESSWPPQSHRDTPPKVWSDDNPVAKPLPESSLPADAEPISTADSAATEMPPTETLPDTSRLVWESSSPDSHVAGSYPPDTGPAGAPASDDPATGDPATEDPATGDPATDDPATDASVTAAPTWQTPDIDYLQPTGYTRARNRRRRLGLALLTTLVIAVALGWGWLVIGHNNSVAKDRAVGDAPRSPSHSRPAGKGTQTVGGGVDPMTRSVVRLGGGTTTHVVEQHIVATAASTLSLTMPVWKGFVIHQGFDPRVRDLVVLANGLPADTGSTALAQGDALRVALPRGTTRVVVSYRATGTVVRTEPSSANRALALIGVLDVRGTADASSTVEINGPGVLQAGCVPPDQVLTTCGGSTSRGWEVKLGAGQRDIDIVAQVDLP